MAWCPQPPLRPNPQTWRQILSPEEYKVLRQKGTEPPGTGEYNKFYQDGLYVCRGCGNPLYT